MTSVKVAVRVRPLNKRERDADSSHAIATSGNILKLFKPKHSYYEGLKTFTFDYCFAPPDVDVLRETESQEEVFKSVGKQIVQHALTGFNACVLAYGQTGSGKTYTMLGDKDNPGLIPRICEDLFQKMEAMDAARYKFKLESSFMEIYNEKVRDLLAENKSSLRVREHPKLGPYVEELSKYRTHSYTEIQELLEKGSKTRFTAATNMNDTSSRSHAVFTLHLKQIQLEEGTNQPRELYSKIHLVDLAGSERAAAAGSTGERLKEGGHINKSLSALGLVIHALSGASESSNPFVPYRDSVLTWLLKDSLGGNSHTVMVATVSPAAANYGETLSTLRYASRAMNIVNKPMVNEDPQTKLIRQLREEIARLHALLASRSEGSQSSIVRQLEETRAKEQLLTEKFQHRWQEFQEVFNQEENLSIAKTLSGSGIILDSQQPHLICLEAQDPACSGIILYNLKPGVTRIGSGSSDFNPDIVVSGEDINSLHCCIEMSENQVTLEAISTCFVDGTVVDQKTNLSPGSIITLGETAVFQFKDPRCSSTGRVKKSLAVFSLSPIHRLHTPSRDKGFYHPEDVALMRQDRITSTPGSPFFSDSDSEDSSVCRAFRTENESPCRQLRSYSAWNLSCPNSDLSEDSYRCTPSSFPLSRSFSVDSSCFSSSLARQGSKGSLQISITDFALTGSGRWSHYEYHVKINASGNEAYSLWRRYSKFRDLHAYLSRKYGEPVSELYFPPRKWFGNNSEATAKERRHLLEAYLRRVIEVCSELPNCPLYRTKSKQALMNLAPFFRQGIFESSMCYQI